MTTTDNRPPLPPITCQPWCSDGNGHIDAFCVADQDCSSAAVFVPMSREPESEYDGGQMGLSLVQAGAFQTPGQAPYIELGWEMDKETNHVELTVAEARTLAEFMLRMCDAIDQAQR
jgi:hypothetical protein